MDVFAEMEEVRRAAEQRYLAGIDLRLEAGWSWEEVMDEVKADYSGGRIPRETADAAIRLFLSHKPEGE